MESKINPEIKILLVDDDVVDAKIIKRALLKENISNEMLHAKDGYEALKTLDEHASEKFILFVDLNMPNLNGIDLLKKIKTEQKYSNNMIFVLSGSNSMDDKLAAYDLDIDGYINKDRAGKNFARLANIVNKYWQIHSHSESHTLKPL